MSLNYKPAGEVWIKAIEYMKNPPQGVPMPWWPKFNHLLGGLRPYELTLLCAPTGAGKTQLLANLSAQLFGERVPHFVAPVETGDTDFLIRVLSALDKKDMNDGTRISDFQIMALTKKYAELFQQCPLLISNYDNRVDIHEMINLLRYMHESYGIKVALLDNLNFFLRVVSSQNERKEMDDAMHEFVMLAKQLPIHLILIVHPRKTDGGRVESEFDIKGSSLAVQEASNVCIFNRPHAEDVENAKRNPTDRELVFKKIRKRGVNVNRPLWFAYLEGRLSEYKS